MSNLSRVVAVSCLLVAAGSTGHATTYVVRPDGTGDFPTIQAAIAGSVDGDIIELTNGVFSGTGNRDIEFLGKAITVRSQGGDPTTCVIDCGGSGHRGFIFTALEQSDSILEGVSITNSDFGVDWRGSAIDCVESAPTISRCVIRGNRGSAIAAETHLHPWGGPILQDCLITGNSTDRIGGAIYNNVGWGSLRIVGCTISGNRAASLAGGIFGQIVSNTELERSVIWGNCADSPLAGDDIFLSEAEATFTCCVVDSTGIGWIGGYGPMYVGFNAFVNPVFCDPAPCEDAPTTQGDYHVDAASICLPPANPCAALIGALGQGCSGTIPVVERSWGGIKALYRR